ncbi:MAG TPA: hypothetical protein VMW73_10545 [Spirochaetia bacterium]|nr:hypothetical protein [Spirochaetia bacterium]
MQRTSRHGIDSGRRNCGYVLLDALVLLFIAAVGLGALTLLVSSTCRGVFSCEKRVIETIAARNERDLSRVQDRGVR